MVLSRDNSGFSLDREISGNNSRNNSNFNIIVILLIFGTFQKRISTLRICMLMEIVAFPDFSKIHP